MKFIKKKIQSLIDFFQLSFFINFLAFGISAKSNLFFSNTTILKGEFGCIQKQMKQSVKTAVYVKW